MRLVAVGHIVNDIVPNDHLGGGVSYSAVAARRLGCEAHIITKCPQAHHYVADLERMGVHVHPLPTKLETITSFCNTYDQGGRRKQQVTEVQEPISLSDLRHFPQEILRDATVLIAPVIGEVDTNLYPALAAAGKLLAVTPQGYFREIASDGTVTQQKWHGFEDNLTHARVTVLSEEDIATAAETPDHELLDAIVKACPIVALTRGSKGASLYQNGKAISVGAFPLGVDETNDFTGAGDTFATVLVTELARGVQAKAAAVSAAFFAAIKIKGLTQGIGIDSIPTIEETVRFRTANERRVELFLNQEGISNISLFE